MRLRTEHLLNASRGLYARAVHRLRRALSPAERERARLRRLSRYEPFRTPLLRLLAGPARAAGLPSVAGPDAASFLAMVDEIFDRQMYLFPAGPAPVIIDAGANIGVSVLFFRGRYPGAKISAYEADPRLFAYLASNVDGTDVRSAGTDLVNKAVWDSETTLTFVSEGANAGRVDGIGADAVGHRIAVPTVRLRDLLATPVDLLKIDVEGAEVTILADCADRLSNVAYLFVEHHSFADKPQDLDRLLSILRTAGFRVVIEAPVRSRHPLVGRLHYQGMDVLANIFAYRPPPPPPA